MLHNQTYTVKQSKFLIFEEDVNIKNQISLSFVDPPLLLNHYVRLKTEWQTDWFMLRFWQKDQKALGYKFLVFCF